MRNVVVCMLCMFRSFDNWFCVWVLRFCCHRFVVRTRVCDSFECDFMPSASDRSWANLLGKYRRKVKRWIVHSCLIPLPIFHFILFRFFVFFVSSCLPVVNWRVVRLNEAQRRRQCWFVLAIAFSRSYFELYFHPFYFCFFVFGLPVSAVCLLSFVLLFDLDVGRAHWHAKNEQNARLRRKENRKNAHTTNRKECNAIETNRTSLRATSKRTKTAKNANCIVAIPNAWWWR